MVVRRNGWLYVSVTNESNQNVYFDDLVINHKRGPVLEETNYYPFGMEIPGISTKANKGSNYALNRYKYNGKELQSKEFNDTTELGWEDYGARMYDVQIGRWHMVDPKADESRRWSPYNYAYDNPMRYIDPSGMKPEDDYKINKKGLISLVRKTNDKTDKLYATDKKGNIDTKKSITVNKGVLNNIKTGQVKGEGKTYTYNYVQANNGDAKKVFEFAANNSNIEWTLLKFSDGQNFVSTTHEQGMEAGATGILSDNNRNIDKSKLIEHDHSHPDGIHYPSGLTPEGVNASRGGDIEAAKREVKSSPNVQFNIYTPSDGQYTPYHSTDKEPDMQPVIITAPRKKKATE